MILYYIRKYDEARNITPSLNAVQVIGADKYLEYIVALDLKKRATILSSIKYPTNIFYRDLDIVSSILESMFSLEKYRFIEATPTIAGKVKPHMTIKFNL